MIAGVLSFSPAKDLKLSLNNNDAPENNNTSRPTKKSGSPLFKFALVADSHNNNEDLKKALAQAKAGGAKFVIGLGDFSDVGTIKELEDAKQVFETSGLPFYVIPGDHDLWDSRDKGSVAVNNYSQVFGMPYQAFSDSGVRFILTFNSDNYNGVDDLQFNWLKNELNKVQTNQSKSIYIFLHEPLVHPTSDQVMGSPRKTGEADSSRFGEAGSARKTDPAILENTKIKEQAKELLNNFKNAGVAGIFAGDIHAYTSYTDMASNMNMVTVGAITKERNTEAPRFATVDVYADGSYNISDIEVE